MGNPAFNPQQMSSQEMAAAIIMMQAQMKVMADALSQTTDALHKAQENLERQAEELRIINLHIGMINEAKTIEETLQTMGKLGAEALQCDCTVYSVETIGGDVLFTANEENERTYITVKDNTLLQQAIQQGKAVFDNDYSSGNAVPLGDGKENRHIRNTMAVPLANQHGEVIGVVVAKDKSDGQERFEEKDAGIFDLATGSLGETFRMGLEKKSLMQEATIDPLTHLTNRNGMNRFIENVVLEKAKRHEPVSTIVIDIDYFKQYNSNYGHDGGDACLKMVADALKSNVRMTADSAIVRTGGDEMLLILPVDEERAFEIAERIRHAVQETPLVIGDQTTNVTLTLGVASYAPAKPHNLDRSNIVEHYNVEGFKPADENLYKAKEAGRNCTYGSDELMLTHHSTPSVTETFGRFLESICLKLVQEGDGYTLHDVWRNGDEVLKRDFQTPQEVVAFLSEQDLITRELISGLNERWHEYAVETCPFAVEGSEFKGKTPKDWADFIKNSPVFDTEAGKIFRDANETDILIVQALSSRVSEIKLDKIAEVPAPAEQQLDEKARNRKEPSLEM